LYKIITKLTEVIIAGRSGMRNVWFVVMVALVVLYALNASAQDDLEVKKGVEKAVEVKEETKAEVVKAEAEAETEESKIEVKEVEPFSYCAIEMTGSYDQHTEAFGKLYSSAEKSRLPMNRVPFGVYYDDDPSETPEEDLKWEVGFKMPEHKDIEEPLVFKKWEFKLVASRYYDGPFSGEGIEQAYAEIMQWIEEKEYTIVGPCMERYLGMPRQNEDGTLSGKLEIWMPVEKVE